jgi:hypothetical protein
MLCQECYRDIPPGLTACPFCARPEETVPPVEAEGCAWEARESFGTFNAFGDTLQKSLFTPTKFFQGVSPVGGIGAALLYAVIVGTLSAAVAMMWHYASFSPADIAVVSSWEIPPLAGYVWAAGLMFLPLLNVAATVLRGLVLHLSLAVVGGGAGDLGATLKVVSYAASASAFNVFPFIGAPFAFLWRVVLTVIGLREVHRITTARAFVAWLLPAIVIGFFATMVMMALAVAFFKVFPALMDEFMTV